MDKHDYGIVTSIKAAQNPAECSYFVLFKDRVERIMSTSMLELYEKVVLGQKVENEKGLPSYKVTLDGKATDAEYKKAVANLLDTLPIGKSHQSGIEELDAITAKMLPALQGAAKRLLSNLITGSPVMVRFHNDCDGSSGAVALHMAVLKISSKLGFGEPVFMWRMNRGVYYQKELLDSDSLMLRSYSAIENPIIFITDFGTAPESEISIRAAKGSYDFIWLDHHPVHDSFPRDDIPFYINPWNYGGDSDYTAGFLTSNFAELISGEETRKFKLASLIGDYSRYAVRSDKAAVELSTVLDHLTSRRDLADSLTPRYIESVIESEESFYDAFGYAERLFEESLDLGMRNLKHYTTKDGIKIYVLDFQKVSDESADYPLPGRYSSRLQEQLEKNSGGKSMTVVHYGNYISLRISRHIKEFVNIHKRMERLKEESSYIYSFGGHDAAGSIKVDKDHAKEVIRLLLKDLGVTLG
jgi:RecJ-like exonuclease